MANGDNQTSYHQYGSSGGPGNVPGLQTVMPADEAAAFLLGSADIPTGVGPGVQRQRSAEQAYYENLRGVSGRIMDTARASAAQTSGDLSRSMVAANAGRNPFAAQQSALAAGGARAQLMGQATLDAEAAEGAYRQAMVDRPTEGQATEAEINQGMTNLDAYIQSANRGGHPPSHGEIYEYITKVIMKPEAVRVTQADGSVKTVMRSGLGEGAKAYWTQRAQYYYLLARGFSPALAARNAGTPTRSVGFTGPHRAPGQVVVGPQAGDPNQVTS